VFRLAILGLAGTLALLGADRIAGQVVRFVGMPLDGLEEGPYDLVLEVQDEVSGARLLHHEPFTLAREARSY
jgi:hypothetical protein